MAVVIALEWVPVESRVFTGAAYRDGARQLYLRFRDGDIYRYFNCRESVYREFLAADSKGGYFSEHIRSRFRHELVHQDKGCKTASESLEQQLSSSVQLAKARAGQKRAAPHAAGVQD
jgi:hypothetical protein